MTTVYDSRAKVYATSRELRPPVGGDAWEYFNYLGNDPLTDLVAPTERNMIRGKPEGQVIGTPVVQDCAVRCTGLVNYIQAMTEAMAQFTFIAIARPVLPDAGGVPLISNTGSVWPTTGTAISGSALYLNDVAAGNGLLRLTTQQGANNAGTAATVAASTGDFTAATAGFQMFVGRCFPNGDRIAKIMGLGLTSVPVNSALPAALAQPLRIGSQYNGAAVGPVDIAGVGILSAALSDVDLTTLYAFLKRPYLRRQIII